MARFTNINTGVSMYVLKPFEINIVAHKVKSLEYLK